MKLILVVFAVSFLTSCASNSVILQKTIPGDEKTFATTDTGTVEVIGQDMTTESMHWLFAQCDHWSGCYMRCQGKTNFCKKVTTDFKLNVLYSLKLDHRNP